MEESVRNAALLVIALAVSSNVYAQGDSGGPFKNGLFQGFESEQAAKAFGCTMAVNKALSTAGDGWGYNTGATPFNLAPDGKLNVFQQDRIISRETKGDTETIEFKSDQLVNYEKGNPVYETVRKTVTIKRNGGQVVAIAHPQDVKKLAAGLTAMKASGEKSDYKLLKSTETTFKSKSDGGCVTDQKAYVLTKDEKGNGTETQVTYDSAFCEGLKPTIARVGANNAAECGTLLSSAERIFNERNNALKAEGKTFAVSGLMYGDAKESAKYANSTLTMSMAIANCVQEQQGSGGLGGMGMPGMGAYLGTGMMSDMYKKTGPAKSDLKKSLKVNPAVK
jgi:hypothetical protein